MVSTLLNSLQLIANAKAGQRENIDSRVFGKKLGLISRIIGCPHKDVGRPFVEGKTGYRSCLGCGARKPFNTETLETSAAFYCPPPIQT
jgi:hypothetical protein